MRRRVDLHAMRLRQALRPGVADAIALEAELAQRPQALLVNQRVLQGLRRLRRTMSLALPTKRASTHTHTQTLLALALIYFSIKCSFFSFYEH